MNKKISTPLAISIIVVLAVIVGGGIYTYQYPKSEFINDETANWETFTQKGYWGDVCSIKYPDSWEVRNDTATNSTYLVPKKKNIPEDIWVAINCFPKNIDFTNAGKDLKPLCQKAKFSLAFSEKFEAVNGRTYCILSNDGSQIGNVQFLVRYGRQRMDYYIPDSELQNELKVFNEMLLTFKFENK